MINGTGTGTGLGQVITPAIVTPTTGTTCICVPPGRCTTSPSTSDGSGVIDIRIVTGVWLIFFLLIVCKFQIDVIGINWRNY